MEKSPQELLNERNKRIEDAIQLKVPDRVPFAPFMTFFPLRYAGLDYEKAMHDYNTLCTAIKKTVLELQTDACPDTFRALSWAPTFEILDYRPLKWPGHGLPPNTTYQFVEGEYMSADEYDAFLHDPTDFMVRIFFPRICGALEPLKALKPLFRAWYTRIAPYVSIFGTDEFMSALTALMNAGKEALTMMSKATEFTNEMLALGFPRQFVGSVTAPFDYLGDYMRGTRGIMLDMYRNPDKLLEACDKLLPPLIDQAISVPKGTGGNRIVIPLHKGLDGFMSQEQFKKFFWPALRKLMLAIIDAGFTPNPIFEGNCTSRLEIIADIPRGKAVYWFERTDIFKAKEILGNTVCIEAGIPSSLMIGGSIQEVKEYCKKLIDVVGKGGGLIINGDVGIPDEAKPENVKTLADFVKEYGVYR